MKCGDCKYYQDGKCSFLDGYVSEEMEDDTISMNDDACEDFEHKQP